MLRSRTKTGPGYQCSQSGRVLCGIAAADSVAHWKQLKTGVKHAVHELEDSFGEEFWWNTTYETKKSKKMDEQDLTVGRLMEKLASLPPDMLVGVIGHFGEFYPMRLFSCAAQQSPCEDVDGMPVSEAFVLSPPDIGPEPD